MPRPAVLAVAALWFALGYANYRRPATMYRLYNWPAAPDTDVGETVRTTYRRRGLIAAAIGVPFLVWGLLAS
ncbi:hypothetical protein B4589_006540 [Halolamina sp. CBA1230]|uniref:hypothetical protein n=1 Tax=Halolamina sp. CBA1230 TaxID=1853690 RepID=UPI0009A17697|nr:hypothetical protein [Halolamina sp. CBA1230]QKY20051.1 hypothetical protein B4589_006540 [Halolamina sp. CBA1230]